MPITSPEGGAPAPSSGTSSTSSSTSSSPAATPSTPAPASTPASTSPASPSPSSSPATPAVEAPSPPSTFNFDEIFQIDEAPAAVVAPASPPVSAVPAAPESVVVKPPVAAEAPQPVVQPQTPPQTPAAAESRPQGGSPPPSPADPASLARMLVENKQAAIDHLAASTFALTSAEIEALETDAVGTIPKLLSRAVVETQAMTLQHLARSVPLMIQNYLKVSQANSENESAFYSKWPSIKPAEHGELVKRVAQTYRQANPSIPMEQMITDVGTIVMQLAKLQPSAAAHPGNGSRPPQSSPFVPASGGTAAAPQPVEETPWGILDPSRET